MLTRLGIVGCGNVAVRHLAQFRAIGQERVVVTRVYDIVRSRAGAFTRLVSENLGYTPSQAEDLADLMNHEIDGALVLTPHPSHAEITLELLRAGKHVYCEKPLGTSRQWNLVEEVMLEARSRQSEQALVVTPFEGYPEVDEALRLATSGIIGRIRGGNYYKVTPGPTRAWYYKQETAHDGALFDAAIYGISRFIRLFGAVEKVSAKRVFGGRFSQPEDGPVEADVDVEADLLLRHRGGAFSHIFAAFSGFEAGTSQARFSRGITIDCQSIEGEQGSIHINGLPDRQLSPVPPLLIHVKGEPAAELFSYYNRRADLESALKGFWFEPAARIAEASERQIAFFLKCIAGEEHPDLERTFQIAKVLQRAHESAEAGGRFLNVD